MSMEFMGRVERQTLFEARRFANKAHETAFTGRICLMPADARWGEIACLKV